MIFNRWRGPIGMAFDWFSVFALLYLVRKTGHHPAAVLVAFLGIARAQHSLLLYAHESLHGTLVPGPRLNWFFGQCFALGVMGSGWHLARLGHAAHHRYLWTERDDDYGMHHLATRRAFARHFLFTLAFGMLIDKIRYLRFPDPPNHRVTRTPVARRTDNVAIAVSSACAGLGIAYLFSFRDLGLLWILPMVSWTALLHRIKLFCDHATLPGEPPEQHLSVIPDLWDWLLLGAQQRHHGAHHLRPGVPWWSLPALAPSLGSAIRYRRGYFRFVLSYCRVGYPAGDRVIAARERGGVPGRATEAAGA